MVCEKCNGTGILTDDNGVQYDDVCPLCQGFPDEEPDMNDEVKCCPNCERPNQFGELCISCEREMDAEYEAYQYEKDIYGEV